jgi:hypothetical protein
MDKVAGIEDAWTGCVQKANDRFTYYRDKLLHKGTPSCLDQSAIDTLRAAVDALRASEAPTLYCDDGAAAPDPVTALDIPDKKQEAIGETSAAKVVLGSSLYATKCYLRIIGNAARSGAVTTYDTDKLAQCLVKASSNADASIDDLEQTQKLPACLSAQTTKDTASGACDFSGSLTGAVYCQSPSAAFVDGAPVL